MRVESTSRAAQPSDWRYLPKKEEWAKANLVLRSTERFKWVKRAPSVARDALIIFFALMSIGSVVVAIAGGDPANLMLARIAAVASMVLFGIVGFSISRYLMPRKRWIYLLRVTACVWLLILAIFALVDRRLKGSSRAVLRQRREARGKKSRSATARIADIEWPCR